MLVKLETDRLVSSSGRSDICEVMEQELLLLPTKDCQVKLREGSSKAHPIIYPVARSRGGPQICAADRHNRRS